MRIIVLLGAPGSGKGTVAGHLAASLERFYHVSSGDMLREAVRSRNAVGLQADGYMRRGELVPDELIARMVGDLARGMPASSTLILDGFPRTLGQAELLDATVLECAARLGPVVLLSVGEELLINRISGRRLCSRCGEGYHVSFMPPQRDGVCDRCGAPLIVRRDDKIETVRRRLQVYKAQTLPLIGFYEDRGQLCRIDGEGAAAEVVERVRLALV